MKLGFTYMYTNDQAKAKYFYEEFLGLPLICDTQNNWVGKVEQHQRHPSHFLMIAKKLDS